MLLSNRRPLEQAAPDAPVDERRLTNTISAAQATRAERAMRPPLTARLAARAFAGTLDRSLMEGADPVSSPRLAARAAQLTSRASRDELAEGLGSALRSAQRSRRSSSALTRRAPVLANAALLAELAGVLRGPAPLYAGGIARVRRLLTDGTSPMYTSPDASTLERELRKARTAVTR